MHDVNSLYCGNHISYIFDVDTGLWWQFDDDEITKMSDFTEGVYT